MGKLKAILITLLFLLLLFCPFGSFISGCFGYRFVIKTVSVYTLAVCLFAFGVLIADIFLNGNTEARFFTILRYLSVLLAVIDCFLFILSTPTVQVVVCSILSLGFCYFLTIRSKKSMLLKVVTLAFPIIIFVPMIYISLLVLIFGSIGQNTVVHTAASPSRKYLAEVVDSDQGAMGGDTIVLVREAPLLDNFLFTIEKKPQKVYLGQWGEFRNMKISWKDDGHLLINSVEYEIG